MLHHHRRRRLRRYTSKSACSQHCPQRSVEVDRSCEVHRDEWSRLNPYLTARHAHNTRKGIHMTHTLGPIKCATNLLNQCVNVVLVMRWLQL